MADFFYGITFQVAHLYSDIVRRNPKPDIKNVFPLGNEREAKLHPIMLVHLWSIKKKMEAALSKK